MRQLLFVSLAFIALAINLVSGDQSVEKSSIDSDKSDENSNSLKTKRGIYNHAIPYGHKYVSYTPYAKFPGIYKGFNTPGFTLTPGNAVIHSYNVNYPKIYLPRPAIRPIIPPPSPPLLFHSKPILPVSSAPIYAQRFPVFVQKSVYVPPAPHFTVPSFVPAVPASIRPLNPITISNTLPQSTLISQDGWKPVFSAHDAQNPLFVNPPAVTVLPPFPTSNSPSQLAGSSLGHTPNNYYLPPDQSLHGVESHPHTLTNDGLSHANGNFSYLYVYIML